MPATGVTDQHLVGRVKCAPWSRYIRRDASSARRGVPGATFKCYDGKTLPFTTGSFDVVIGICVLHHVPLSEQLSFVREMNRVAAPDGLLVIFEHNPANPLTRRARGCELDRGVVLLTPGDVERLRLQRPDAVCPDASIPLVTPFGGLLGASLDRPFRRFPLGGQYAVVAEA